MESQEGHNPALEWRGKSAKPHGIRTETVRFGKDSVRIPYGFEWLIAAAISHSLRLLVIHSGY